MKRPRHLSRVHITISHLLRLNDLFADIKKKDALIRGRASERYVKNTLWELAAKGKIPATEDDIIATEPYSEAGRHGIDLILITDRGAIPIQVKSSRHAVLLFQESHSEEIICCFVNRYTKKGPFRRLLRRKILWRYHELEQRMMI